VREENEDQLVWSVIRLNGIILGLAFGIVIGSSLFVATNWLVLKGGETVGPHLQLLSQLFPGYSVSFLGSFIGLAYGCVTGFVLGWLIALIYNGVLRLRNLG